MTLSKRRHVTCRGTADATSGPNNRTRLGEIKFVEYRSDDALRKRIDVQAAGSPIVVSGSLVIILQNNNRILSSSQNLDELKKPTRAD